MVVFQVSNWLMKEIVTMENVEERVALVSRLVDIMEVREGWGRGKGERGTHNYHAPSVELVNVSYEHYPYLYLLTTIRHIVSAITLLLTF